MSFRLQGEISKIVNTFYKFRIAMKKLLTWYKNMNLSSRVIFSMNLAIFGSILIISVFATLNRINVQKNEARVLVENELGQVTNLLNFLQDRSIDDLNEIIRSRVFYNTGFISLIAADGNVLICRQRQGQNVSGSTFFTQLRTSSSREIIYTDPQTGKVNYQYHTYHEPLRLYITATLEKSEFIDKPVRNTLMILLFALIFTWAAFSTTNYFIMKTITTPINGLVKVVRELGKGSLADTYNYSYKDEVGQITQSVNHLVDGLRRTALFANEIGKNNFDHPYEPLSEKDVLGNALLDMRQSLKAANDEEKLRKVDDEKRNWTTQGLARFADILRQNNSSINELSYDIIRNLVDYLEVNQGGIFILSDEDKKNQFLELTACYAFDRRKFLEKKILPGEGLVGTCFLERESIHIMKIPQDYIRITSGLGDENPSSLLLIPLKINDEMYGVIELASFNPFEKHKLEFVEKIGESIASTISSVKINSQTAMLLEKSQQQAEEMRAQEEEMRQNMEELSATQEAMAEKDRENVSTIENLTKLNQDRVAELKSKEQEILDTLEDCPEGVVKSDESGTIIFFNKESERLWGFSRQEVLGKDVKMLMPDAYARDHAQFMKDYLHTGEKKIIGTGRTVEILKKSGEKHSIYLTIVETRIEDDIFFTGFFTDSSKFSGSMATLNPDPQPSAPADQGPDKAPDTAPEKNPEGVTTTESNVEDAKDSKYHKQEEAISENQKAGKKKSDSPKTKEHQEESDSDLTSLHQGDATDNQKAWTKHISQKGKGFRKSRKK
jgi:PAS domain S-box-containing protein